MAEIRRQGEEVGKRNATHPVDVTFGVPGDVKHKAIQSPLPVRPLRFACTAIRMMFPKKRELNLHREYDFSDAKMTDSIGLELTPTNLELSLV